MSTTPTVVIRRSSASNKITLALISFMLSPLSKIAVAIAIFSLISSAGYSQTVDGTWSPSEDIIWSGEWSVTGVEANCADDEPCCGTNEPETQVHFVRDGIDFHEPWYRANGCTGDIGAYRTECLPSGNGPFDVDLKLIDCELFGCWDQQYPTENIGTFNSYKTPHLWDAEVVADGDSCKLHYRYKWHQSFPTRGTEYRYLPSGRQVSIGVQCGDLDPPASDCNNNSSYPSGNCCAILPTPSDTGGEMFLEIAAKACGGDDSGETTIEVVPTAACVPGCEDGDLFCEEIYADSCEDPNTNEPNTGPMVPPGIYAPTGNFRYTESDPLPTWAPFLANRTVDSLNENVGLFGQGWFSVFDASVEDVFPDLTDGKYYRVTTEENLNVYFREEGDTYHQVWPTNGPLGSLEAVSDVDGDSEPEFSYTDPDGRYVRRFDSDSGYRLSNIQDVRTGKSVQITYDTNGVPESVVESDGNWSWAVTPDAADQSKIGSISADGDTLTYTYSGDLLDSVTVNGAAWRTSSYDADGRLTTVKDGVDNFISQATYIASSDPDYPGRVFSVSNRNTEITEIEYEVPAGDVDTAAGEYVVRVTQESGAVTDYYIRPVPRGPEKVTMVKGDCSGCGGAGEFAVMGYDGGGRLVRKQDAMGEITEWSYDFMGRVSEKREGYTLDAPACVPLGSPYCYVTGETELMDENTVLHDAGVTTASFTYDDWDWRYRPTAVCRDSLLQAGEEACRSFEYDSETGVAISEKDSGWTSEEKHEERTTTTELYDGSSVAIFNPATEASLVGVTDLTFQSKWADYSQPEDLVSEVNGPLSADFTGDDITEYVYYPRNTAVPAVLQGRLAAIKDPTGYVTFYDGYDAHGRVTRLIDSRGVRTDFTYDAIGRVLTSTVLGNCNTDFGFDLDPNCNIPLTTTYTYQATTGPLTSVTPPSGASVAVYGYDGWGRTESVSRGNSGSDLRERVLYAYDPVHWGRVSSEKLQEPDGGGWDTLKETGYSYQGFGRLHRTIYPRVIADADPPFDEYTYDAAGNVLLFEDGNHDSPNVTYTYDVHGRLVMVRSLYAKVGDTEFWAVTEYGYDANDNLTLVRDAEDFETEYSVDDFGQTYEIDSPATGITQLTYDLGGRLRTRKDARGVEEIRVYDLSGRLKQSDFTLGEEEEKTLFDYQKGYEVQSTADHADGGRTTQSQRYDRRGLVLESTQDNEKTIRFEYDLDGNFKERTSGICERVSHDVDWAGRPQKITVTLCTGTEVIADGVTYRPFGPATTILRRQAGDFALEESLDYDFQYRTISQGFRRTGSGAETLVDRSYGTPGLPDGYDGAGNLLLVNDSAMPERDRVYTYDEMSRLIGAAAPQSIGELKYTYDLVGNRTKYEFGEKDPPENSDDSTYDSGTGLLLQITEVRAGSGQVSYSLTHDEVGNLAAESDPSDQTYAYNFRNQLADHNGLLGFVYDAHGRRVKTARTMAPFPGKTVTHYLLPDGRPYLDVPYSQSSSAPQWSYVYLGDRLLARFDNNNYEHVVSDHIGFPLATIDNEGSVLWQPDPQPFGTIHAEESVGDGHDPLIRFPGQWAHDPFLVATEPEFSTLYYNFHRWYKPGWGRYTQADPVGILSTRGGLAELYAYGYGNPTRFIDPEGLDVRVCCRPLQPLPSYDHCYVESDGSGRRRTWGLYQQHGWAVYRMNDPDDVGGDCGPWTPDECGDVEDCIQKKAQNYPLLRYPFAGFGRNSNTFARCVSESCGVTTPKSVHEDAPFWGFRCPPGQTSQ